MSAVTIHDIQHCLDNYVEQVAEAAAHEIRQTVLPDIQVGLGDTLPQIDEEQIALRVNVLRDSLDDPAQAVEVYLALPPEVVAVLSPDDLLLIHAPALMQAALRGITEVRSWQP